MDNPLAVISHESALAIHQLSDVMPARIHLSVPPAFRKPAPRGCVFHKAALSAQDVEQRDGFRVTTPLRTLLDIASDGKTTREQLFQAVADALDRGLIRKKKLLAAVDEHPQARSLLLAPSLTR
jgi:predicted transcriptional regulator of viral defense system